MYRYNNFQHDPLSRCNCTPPYSGENAISARSDLNPANGTYPFGALGHRSHGGTDNKVCVSVFVSCVSLPILTLVYQTRISTQGFFDIHVYTCIYARTFSVPSHLHNKQKLLCCSAGGILLSPPLSLPPLSPSPSLPLSLSPLSPSPSPLLSPSPSPPLAPSPSPSPSPPPAPHPPYYQLASSMDVLTLSCKATSGPTYTQQPVFRWSTSEFSRPLGHPDKWNFTINNISWVAMEGA